MYFYLYFPYTCNKCKEKQKWLVLFLFFSILLLRVFSSKLGSALCCNTMQKCKKTWKRYLGLITFLISKQTKRNCCIWNIRIADVNLHVAKNAIGFIWKTRTKHQMQFARKKSCISNEKPNVNFS